MNQLMQHPSPDTKVFKFNTCTYSLSHSYGHWTLRKIVAGQPKPKPEITCKTQDDVFDYLAKAERRTHEQARIAYENTFI